MALIKGHEKWLNGKGSKARVSPLMQPLLKRLVYIGNFFEPQMQATNLSQRLKLSAVVHEMINLRMLSQIKIESIQGFKFLRAYLGFPCQSFSERDNHMMTSRQHPRGFQTLPKDLLQPGRPVHHLTIFQSSGFYWFSGFNIYSD